MVLSLLLGVVFVLPLMSRRRYVRGMARGLVDSGRCIPFLLLTYLVYYALPSLGLSLDKWTAALITLVIYNTAYMAEILRAAWVHLPQGQTEAGRAFGYTGVRLFRRIILPQVLIAVGPVVGNQLIQLIKESAFLYIISVPEFKYVGKYVQTFYFLPIELFITTSLILMSII